MAKDYPFIRAWCAVTGSSDWYTRDRIEEAKRMNAPANATYRRWHPLSEDDPIKHGASDEWATYDAEAIKRWPAMTTLSFHAVLRRQGNEALIIKLEPIE